MAGYANRGGVPFARHLVATDAGVISSAGVSNSAQPAGTPVHLPAVTTWLRIGATTNDVHVYFNQADFDGDRNFLLVEADAHVDGPIEVRELWLRGVVGDSTVSLLAATKG